MMNNKLQFLLIGVSALLQVACGAPKQQTDTSDIPQSIHGKIEIEQINEQLNLATSDRSSGSDGYKVHVSDILKIVVFQVEELSQEYQVGSRGRIFMPLIGEIRVRGLRIDDIQRLLVEKLSKDLLKNPQVNVSIAEYAPQQVTVMGAVSRPDIYNITQGRNIYEMLTLAGGFANDAGSTIYVKSTQHSESTGALETVTLSIDVKDMFRVDSIKALEIQQDLKRLLLADGDSVFVSKAGVVYVDGPIKKPGKYTLEGDTTVTQILAIAGGGDFVSTERKVRILRRENGEVKVYEVNINKIRSGKEKDFLLIGGDIVTIGKSAFKTATKGFFDYFLRLVFLF